MITWSDKSLADDGWVVRQVSLSMVIGGNWLDECPFMDGWVVN